MTLTPDEIVEYPLKQSVRGYSVKQVDGLLDEAADTIEQLQEEVESLRERLASAESRLAEVNETEDTLKRALVTAQRAAEQSVADAEEEAERIVADARDEAEQIRTRAVAEAEQEETDARDRLTELQDEVEELGEFAARQRQRLREHLEAHLALLDDAPDVGAGPGDRPAEGDPDESRTRGEATSAPDDTDRDRPGSLWGRRSE